MINKFIGMGYSAKEAKYQQFSSGKSKCNFSIAVSYGNSTTWMEVEAWDKIADNCNAYIKKGTLILVEGKLKSINWKSKTNEHRTKIICSADFVKCIQGKENQNKTEKKLNNVNEIESLSKDLISEEDEEILEKFPW